MRTDSFSTAEDELNFILGTDGEPLFDIMDNTLHAVAEDVIRDFESFPFAASGSARATAATVATPFMTDVAEQGDFRKKDFVPLHDALTLTRMASLSPPPPNNNNGALGAMYPPTDFRDYNEPSFMNEQPTTNFVPQDLDDFKIDFNFDMANEILPSIAPKYLSDLHRRRLWASQQQHRKQLDDEDAAWLLLQDQFHPFLHDQSRSTLLQEQSPHAHDSNHATKNKMWTACNYPPIVHPAQLSTEPKRPFRKRKVEIPNLVYIRPSLAAATGLLELEGRFVPIDIESPDPIERDSPEVVREKAARARNARKMRRSKRARSQAIKLACRAVTEIERMAVLDSNYSRAEAPVEQDLLNDFSRNFNVKVFVDSMWDRVYETLVETGEAKGVAAITSSYPEVDSILEVEKLPSSEPIQDVPEPIQDCMPEPDTSLTAASSNPNDVEDTSSDVGTPKEKNYNLKTLPSGKDPESRRLRRLMRNRLSAQASRDRRKKAIEDMKKQKVVKEKEIAVLEKTVSEEIQRMELLMKAASYAREYLGPEKYSRISGHINKIHSH